MAIGFLPRNKSAWAYRQRECREPREQNCRCHYGSSNHTLWWTPRGLGARRTRGCLTRHLKTLGGGSQNHLESYLRVTKTVTREEAYKGGQKLQTYISSLAQKDQIAHMDTTNPKMTRGCSETTGVSDTRDPKKYVFGLTPPRHNTGGLLSSWLVDQQIFCDRCKWTLLCLLHPREQGSHTAAMLPVLGSGMFQVSQVCGSVTTFCREVFTHLTSGSRQTHLCESKSAHTVVVKQLPVTSKLTVTGKDATHLTGM